MQQLDRRAGEQPRRGWVGKLWVKRGEGRWEMKIQSWQAPSFFPSLIMSLGTLFPLPGWRFERAGHQRPSCHFCEKVLGFPRITLRVSDLVRTVQSEQDMNSDSMYPRQEEECEATLVQRAHTLSPVRKPNRMLAKSLHKVQFFVTLWTAAHHTPLSVEFSRQEYWSGLPFSSPGDLPHPGIEPRSLALWVDSLPLSHQGSPVICLGHNLFNQLPYWWTCRFLSFCLVVFIWLHWVLVVAFGIFCCGAQAL